MQAVITKYLPANGKKGSRVRVTSWFGSKTYPVDFNSKENHKAAFEVWLSAKNAELKERYDGGHDGFKLHSYGEMPDGSGYAFLVW